MQDELETEMARLKDKLARSQKKSSKGASSDDARSIFPSMSSRGSIFSDRELADEVCDLCERPGHDAFNCDMLKEGRLATAGGKIDLYCEDCEGHGHTADNCPHSMDVF